MHSCNTSKCSSSDPVVSGTHYPNACVGFLATEKEARRRPPASRRKEAGRQVVASWERQVVTYQNACEHFCQTVQCEAGGYQKTRQVSVGRLVTQKKTAISSDHHCPLPIKWLVKDFEKGGSESGAGDGTRTRDSLLGRQVAARSPLASYEMAP
jgi:hypothetical protein